MTDMDRYNERILSILQAEGRIANVELAERVGLSPSACLRRVQELERSGVILGYRAVVDRSRVDRAFLAYVAIGLSDHSKAAQIAFEAALAEVPQVREVHNVTGSVEYLVRVETRDLEAYKVIHNEVLGTIPQVVSITTYVVMGSSKDARG
ncbi:MAG TPA: Lrp/AsnC family transcriptional regulator [Pseudomonadales bacterium]|nr:Lrp/AsnC family transcriptional regulator [Pseudomonadales bacterium]